MTTVGRHVAMTTVKSGDPPFDTWDDDRQRASARAEQRP